MVASLPVRLSLAESLPLPVLRLVVDRSRARERTQIEPVARQLGIWSRVRDCGRLVAGERAGVTVIEPRRCKARGCPACDRSRAWRQGRDLVRHATRLGGVLVLATLVRTGSPRESAREAVAATMGALRRVSASRASRRARALGASAWRAVELVENDLGWHCHVHMLVHGPTMAVAMAGAHELAAAWSTAAGTPIERQLVERVRDVARACAYVTKPITISGEACEALRGRKLWTGAGAWSGWSRTGEGRGRVANERPPSQLELEAWAAARGVAARAESDPQASRESLGERIAVDQGPERCEVEGMRTRGRLRSVGDLVFGLVFMPIVVIASALAVAGFGQPSPGWLLGVVRECVRLLWRSAFGIAVGEGRSVPHASRRAARDAESSRSPGGDVSRRAQRDTSPPPADDSSPPRS